MTLPDNPEAPPNLPTPSDPETAVLPDPGNSDMDHLIEPVDADDDVYELLAAVPLDEDDDPAELADPDPANADA